MRILELDSLNLVQNGGGRVVIVKALDDNLLGSEAVLPLGLGSPVSFSTASKKSIPSRNRTSEIASRPLPPQPLQLNACFPVWTENRSVPPQTGHGPASSGGLPLRVIARRASSLSMRTARALSTHASCAAPVIGAIPRFKRRAERAWSAAIAPHAPMSIPMTRVMARPRHPVHCVAPIA